MKTFFWGHTGGAQVLLVTQSSRIISGGTQCVRLKPRRAMCKGSAPYAVLPPLRPLKMKCLGYRVYSRKK